MVSHSLLQWTTFCQTSPPWSYHLGWPHTAWLSFTELDTTVVLWSDWLVFCDYGFSVSALWCPLATPTVLLGFLYISSLLKAYKFSVCVSILLLRSLVIFMINAKTSIWVVCLCLSPVHLALFLEFCCCCSVAKLCLTLCNPMDCSMPVFPVLHYLSEFT